MIKYVVENNKKCAKTYSKLQIDEENSDWFKDYFLA